MTAILHQVAQYASNLDESIAFYRDVLGGNLIARVDPPGLAFIDVNGVRLMLDANVPPALLYFRVDGIDAACDRVREVGVAIESGPSLINRDDNGTFGPVGNEEWMAFFRDPAGNMIAVAEQRAL